MQASSFFKPEKSNNPFSVFTTFIFNILILLGGLIAGTSLYSQTPFVADQQDHTVYFSGTYKDFMIPTNTNIERISFYIRGGSGGIARTSLHPGDITSSEGTTQAGQGAEVFCAFYVGHAPGHIKPGSYVRFIIGGHGGSMSDEGLQFNAAGGGGGASAVLVKQPGETMFTHIMIAGGGGGATRGYEVSESQGMVTADQKSGIGKPGCNTDSGSAGHGAWSGSAGTDGDGGGSGKSTNILHTPISCGGGGILSTGANNDCGQGAGKQAAQSGVAGGNGNCYFTTFVPGGYGYASGGAGVIIDNVVSNDYVSGGGGGGWSGGGGGGVWWAGGGGGGSVIAYDKFNQHPNSNVIIPGGLTATNQNGVAAYYCKLLLTNTPVADCKNIVKELSTSYLAFLTPGEITGPNSVGALNVSPSTINCVNIGQTIPVTLTATTQDGATAQCTAMVQVVDYSVPTITCPDNILVDNSSNTCGTNVQYYGLYSASDNCMESVSTISGLPNGAFFPLGTSTVVLKASDRSGNSATCSFKVTVTDNQVPQLTCKPATVTLNAQGRAMISPSDVFQQGSDNCGFVNLLSVTPHLFTSDNLGTNTVILTVDDGNGNIATCTSIVTVLPRGGESAERSANEAAATDNAELRVKLFPNPSTGDATLQFDLNEDQTCLIQVFDATGRFVSRQEQAGRQGENIFPINLKGLTPGIYLVDMQAGKQKTTQRLVLQQ